jgi:hypothetical protein
VGLQKQSPQLSKKPVPNFRFGLFIQISWKEMASMTNQAQWLCVAYLARLRDEIANGHAMPINPGKLCIGGGSEVCASPLFDFAQGCSVPISRGSPPTSQ